MYTTFYNKHAHTIVGAYATIITPFFHHQTHTHTLAVESATLSQWWEKTNRHGPSLFTIHERNDPIPQMPVSFFHGPPSSWCGMKSRQRKNFLKSRHSPSMPNSASAEWSIVSLQIK
jgi:hypothetical protein